MIIKELFEGPVGDYCIARNTIKCLFGIVMSLMFSFVLKYKAPVSYSVIVVSSCHINLS